MFFSIFLEVALSLIITVKNFGGYRKPVLPGAGEAG